MGKKKLGSVSWEMMFRVNPECDKERDIWSILHKFDREKPEALCEWADEDWYTWHGFLSRKSLNEALHLVFEAFPEVEEIEIYKDTIVGCICTPEQRGKVTR